MAAPETATPTSGPRDHTELRLPRVDDRVAVLVTGLLSGLLMVALGFAANKGNAWVNGNGGSSALGLLGLVLILLATGIFGAAVLKAWDLTEPTSTSFLGIGLVVIIALVFFLSALESPWMVVVLPVLTALTYLASWWVAHAFVDTGD